MSQLAVDHAYTNLLAHLRRPTSTLSQQTATAAVSHYLSTLPLPHPTQLTAIVISSSLWHPLSVNVVWSLVNAFRSAVHFKMSNLEKEVQGWFSRKPEARLGEWIESIIKGISRGDAQIRIAILGGLLLGLDDMNTKSLPTSIGEGVQDHIIIACAEILDDISTADNVWKNEFTVKGTGEVPVARDTLFLSSACQILPLVTSNKLSALDLPTLVHITRQGINTAFLSGRFLSQLSTTATRKSDGQIAISCDSGLSDTLQRMCNSPLYGAISHLAKLLARALSLLAEITPSKAWNTLNETCLDLETILSYLEEDWKVSLLSEVTSEENIEPEARGVSIDIWNALKTLLFTCLLVSQSILSSVIYLPRGEAPAVNASSISRSILGSLYHLAFVISQFGGVSSSHGGFRELKRVFYMALDIIAADPIPKTGNALVQEFVSSVPDLQTDPGLVGHAFYQARSAYVLAVVEQLVPILSETVVEEVVVPFSHPYLRNPTHRETYESAHSVVLSIFAAHATKRDISDARHRPTLADRLVPYYVNSLIENSGEGHLSATQLKVAYSSLVRSTASSGDDALAWLCVEALLSRIKTSTSTSQQMNLYSTLISLISCVPLLLLPRVLEEVEKALEVVKGEERAVLSKGILEEVMGRVGDRERGVAVKWWCELEPKLALAMQEDGI